jgi:hypothetical protein
MSVCEVLHSPWDVAYGTSPTCRDVRHMSVVGANAEVPLIEADFRLRPTANNAPIHKFGSKSHRDGARRTMARCYPRALFSLKSRERQVLKIPATSKIETIVAANIFKP